MDSTKRGVMGCNVTTSTADVLDGTANTLLLAEVRAGVNDQDRRGTWAMGTAGASALFWHGYTGDANGPNAPNDRSDDIRGCSYLHNTNPGYAKLKKERMTCWEPCDSYQATTRGLHPLGILAAYCDGSVHFIKDSIANSGEFGGAPGLWDYLIGSADGVGYDPSVLNF
jgi:hypothetical protein